MAQLAKLQTVGHEVAGRKFGSRPSKYFVGDMNISGGFGNKNMFNVFCKTSQKRKVVLFNYIVRAPLYDKKLHENNMPARMAYCIQPPPCQRIMRVV